MESWVLRSSSSRLCPLQYFSPQKASKKPNTPVNAKSPMFVLLSGVFSRKNSIAASPLILHEKADKKKTWIKIKILELPVPESRTKCKGLAAMPSFSPHIRNRSHLHSSKKRSESLPLAAEKKVTEESNKIPSKPQSKSIPLCHLLSHFLPILLFTP